MKNNKSHKATFSPIILLSAATLLVIVSLGYRLYTNRTKYWQAKVVDIEKAPTDAHPLLSKLAEGSQIQCEGVPPVKIKVANIRVIAMAEEKYLVTALECDGLVKFHEFFLRNSSGYGWTSVGFHWNNGKTFCDDIDKQLLSGALLKKIGVKQCEEDDGRLRTL